MTYDFTTLVDRSVQGSGKWMSMRTICPEAGPDIVPFTTADMDFVHPPELIEGLTDYVRSQIFGYTNPTSRYYNAVGGWMERRHHWKIEKEWIVTVPGVVTGFNAAVRALVRPGEGLLVMPPVYPPFLNASEQAGCRRLEVPLLRGKDRYEIDFAGLEQKAQEPSTKALLFCSPHNPVGRVWTKEELQEVGRICKRCEVTIISDEIHSDIVMPGIEHTTFALAAPFCQENLIVCTAPSKTFNLAGLHTSNIIIPNDALRNAFCHEMRSSVNAVGYEACFLAYTRCEDWLDQLLAELSRTQKAIREYVHANMPEIGVTALEGTYLQWLDFSRIQLTEAERKQFLEKEAMFFTVEGAQFGTGGAGFERMNFACPQKYGLEGLGRLKRVLEEHGRLNATK